MPNDSSGHRQPAQVVDLTARRSRMLGPLQAVRKLSTSTGTARAVLTVLATYADADTFETYVGRITLARDTGRSRSTLRRAIRDLEAAGEVVTLRVGNGDDPSLYRITLSPPVRKPVENPTVPNRERVHHEPGEGSPRTRGRVHHEPRSTETDLNRGGERLPGRCAAHGTVEDPPPCRGCRDARLAADAAAADEAVARRSARECEHGRIEGRRVIGSGVEASRLCPSCEVDSPAPPT